MTDERFEEFWEIFPKRPDGAGTKVETWLFWKQSTARGVDPQTLIVAAYDYRRERAQARAHARHYGNPESDNFTLSGPEWFRRRVWMQPWEGPRYEDYPGLEIANPLHPARPSPVPPTCEALSVPAQIKMEFIARHDDRWPPLAERFAAEKTKDPPIVNGGWYFPSEWIGEIKNEEPRQEATLPKRSRAVALRFMKYANYLRTPEWRAARAKALNIAGYRCQVCNSGGNLNVHHRTYARRGEEEPADLITLCPTCHRLFHETAQLIPEDQQD